MDEKYPPLHNELRVIEELQKMSIDKLFDVANTINDFTCSDNTTKEEIINAIINIS